jgi:hypothetical protein
MAISDARLGIYLTSLTIDLSFVCDKRIEGFVACN